MRQEAEHDWSFIEFNYAAWTECNCGFRPDDEDAFWEHTDAFMQAATS